MQRQQCVLHMYIHIDQIHIFTGARPVHCTSVSEHLTSLSFTAHAAALGNSANNESKSIAKWRVYECNVCRCVRLKCGVCITRYNIFGQLGSRNPLCWSPYEKWTCRRLAGAHHLYCTFCFLFLSRPLCGRLSKKDGWFVETALRWVSEGHLFVKTAARWGRYYNDLDRRECVGIGSIWELM